MKILFLIPTLHGGGSERVLTTIANGIDPSVFEPIFAVLDARNAFFQLDESRVRLVKINEPRVIRATVDMPRMGPRFMETTLTLRKRSLRNFAIAMTANLSLVMSAFGPFQ